MPQAMNIADAEAAVDKEWDKFKNLPALRESKVRRKLLNKHIKKEGRFILLRMSSSEFQCGKEVRTYKGRVVCCGDVVMDDSGSHAVFTEQGSSASHMTAARVLDVSALLDCAGEASDAVSACLPVKMEDPPDSLRLPKSECPCVGYVLHVLDVQNVLDKRHDFVVPPERHFVRTSIGRIGVGATLWKILTRNGNVF